MTAGDDKPNAGAPVGISRRELLQAGSVGLAGLAVTRLAALEASAQPPPSRDINCILLLLVGGPSHLDTWDPKPDAPAEIRGPFQPIRTRVPGMQISELFPRMARIADRFSIVRSLYHTAPVLHDTGHQLLQSGRLSLETVEHPHFGCVAHYALGAREGMPGHVVLPGPIGSTGGNLPHGQSAGYLGATYDPPLFFVEMDPPVTCAAGSGQTHEESDGSFVLGWMRPPRADLMTEDALAASDLIRNRKLHEAFLLDTESEALRRRYGCNRFGQCCLLARRMVERGVRFVTINMFDTVFNNLTWDTHGAAPFTPMDALRTHVAPTFDAAYSTLVEDLVTRGLYESTIVMAVGEFGRTPRLNPAGGRDHWPHCWSMIIGGGPIQGGRVVGASDAIGAEPTERPTPPRDIAATLYAALGIPLTLNLPGPNGAPIPLVDPGARPITELF